MSPSTPDDDSRKSWLDDDANEPLIERYATQLTSFMDAMADGRIDRDELDAQERRVVALMREIEPVLDDATHAKVTRLLCELTAYNLMRTLHEVRQARPAVRFRG